MPITSGMHKHSAMERQLWILDIVGWFGRAILPLAEWILPPSTVCPDIELKDGDTLDHFGLKIRVLHTPGHTVGSVTYIVEDSLAFAGDLILNFPRIKKQCYYANSWGQIDSSVVKLLQHPFKTLYVGHRSLNAGREEIEALKRGKE